MTVRTFQHKVTAVAVGAIVMVAVAALWLLLLRSGVGAVLGLLLVCLDVAAIERVVHSAYVFTADGRLVISRGRFARQQVIAVGEILHAEVRQGPLRLFSYVLIEYGAHRLTSAQPEHASAFLDEIVKRQKLIDDEI